MYLLRPMSLCSVFFHLKGAQSPIVGKFDGGELIKFMERSIDNHERKIVAEKFSNGYQ